MHVQTPLVYTYISRKRFNFLIFPKQPSYFAFGTKLPSDLLIGNQEYEVIVCNRNRGSFLNRIEREREREREIRSLWKNISTSTAFYFLISLIRFCFRNYRVFNDSHRYFILSLYPLGNRFSSLVMKKLCFFFSLFCLKNLSKFEYVTPVLLSSFSVFLKFFSEKELHFCR